MAFFLYFIFLSVLVVLNQQNWVNCEKNIRCREPRFAYSVETNESLCPKDRKITLDF